jgi:hypothetical protein
VRSGNSHAVNNRDMNYQENLIGNFQYQVLQKHWQFSIRKADLNWRVLPLGMLFHVVLYGFTDISEKHTVFFFFSVEEQAKQAECSLKTPVNIYRTTRRNIP